MQAQLHEKYENLKTYLRELGSVLVAFSGGVDSTFLLKVAHDVLGENAAAITATASSFSKREMTEAEEFCAQNGIRQFRFVFHELDVPGFRQNPKNRCYICKSQLFQQIQRTAREQGFRYIAEGSNVDDDGDYRPGMKAVAESGAKSPLRHADLTKQEIRELSRELGLPTWAKPSFACLASRFVYGEEITEKKLAMVERGEEFLADCGFTQYRVRMHGDDLARIEVLEQDIPRLMEKGIREKLIEAFEAAGFHYVAIDIKGFRSGSMNETLTRQELEGESK